MDEGEDGGADADGYGGALPRVVQLQVGLHASAEEQLLSDGAQDGDRQQADGVEHDLLEGLLADEVGQIGEEDLLEEINQQDQRECKREAEPGPLCFRVANACKGGRTCDAAGPIKKKEKDGQNVRQE